MGPVCLLGCPVPILASVFSSAKYSDCDSQETVRVRAGSATTALNLLLAGS